MTPRQLDELQSMPMGQMMEVKKRLEEVGMYAGKLLDDYEERLAIIAEGREVEVADIIAAWESTLRVDLRDSG